MIDIDRVGKIYRTATREIVAVGQVTTAIRVGEFVSIVGPSGCGKTTVLNLIAGFIAPTRGKISVDGFPDAGEIPKGLGYIFQRDTVLPWHTVPDNIALGRSHRQITWTVRIPTTISWAFTALPNAVSFSLIGVVISDFVGSTTGMGYLIMVSLATLNSADMFSALTVLSAVGVTLVFIIWAIERCLLRWSPEFRDRG